KIAPALDWNADGLEVAEAHDVHLDQHAILRRRVRPFGKDAAQNSPRERRRLGDGRPFYAGQRGRTLRDLLVEHLTAFFRIAFTSEIEIDDEHAAGFEAGIEVLRVPQIPEEQAGGNERDERDRHLRDD